MDKMKLVVIFLVNVALCAGDVRSNIPGDNTGYVEGESRYIWMPDDEGVPHLVDLEACTEDNSPGHIGIRDVHQYLLYTRENLAEPQVLEYENIESIRTSNYDHRLPTIVTVHGFWSSGKSDMNVRIKYAVLADAPHNVIVVDWERSILKCYSSVKREVPLIGTKLGNFLVWLFEAGGGDWSKLHLVGHSLGAHVVGIAGRTALGKPGRVTGLDPAGPKWGDDPDKLSTSSGVYVEAIHTNGGFLGLSRPLGHADFYPNGGVHPQPGCWVPWCSHSRAHELFVATIYNNHLYGRKCGSTIEAEKMECLDREISYMGNIITSPKQVGLFGLRTTADFPFEVIDPLGPPNLIK